MDFTRRPRSFHGVFPGCQTRSLAKTPLVWGINVVESFGNPGSLLIWFSEISPASGHESDMART